MAITLIKILFFATLMLSVFCKGICQPCNLSSIKVNQRTTTVVGVVVVVAGPPEYQVEVTNGCFCSQKDVRMQCGGFNTTEEVEVEPSIFRRDRENCVINNGQPMYFGSIIKFKYAWENQAELVPISSQISCS